MRSLLFRFGLLVAFAVPSAAVANDGSSKNYLAFPIKTDLQRFLLHSTVADAYVEFDVNGTVSEQKFDVKSFDHSLFEASVRELRQQVTNDSPKLLVYFRYASINLTPDQTQAMETAVLTACHKAGFPKISTGMRGEGATWQDKLAPFADLPDECNVDESPLSNELVRVFPVRTKAARFLMGAPDIDCVIELRRPIDAHFAELSTEFCLTTAKLIDKLELPQKRKVRFDLQVTKLGREAVDRYFYPAAPVQTVADELGFVSSDRTTSNIGSSPELMVGKQAPDFVLPSLVGNEIRLRDSINGRVALISFWGVACGPCQKEAPHLSALHRQFAERGLAVIAVNGYDESKDVVAKYVQTAGLTHAIALMGSRVAEKQFEVATYPTTYLVDRNGTIIDYFLGYTPGDEAVYAAEIERLLDESPTAKP